MQSLGKREAVFRQEATNKLWNMLEWLKKLPPIKSIFPQLWRNPVTPKEIACTFHQPPRNRHETAPYG